MTISESKGRCFFYKTNRFESIRIANWNALAERHTSLDHNTRLCCHGVFNTRACQLNISQAVTYCCKPARGSEGCVYVAHLRHGLLLIGLPAIWRMERRRFHICILKFISGPT